MKGHAHFSVAALLASLSRHQRLLGLDLGSKTIGLALSDVSRTIATPCDTIRRTKFTKDADLLLAVVDKQEVGGWCSVFPSRWMASRGRVASRCDRLPPIWPGSIR
jgi:hypothetical protein